MKQIFHIYWTLPSYSDTPIISLTNTDMSDIWPEHVCTGTVEVDLGPVPTAKDFEQAQVALLQRRVSDHRAKLAELTAKLDPLLSLTPEGDQS